jgi:hypothetical protein
MELIEWLDELMRVEGNTQVTRRWVLQSIGKMKCAENLYKQHIKLLDENKKNGAIGN